MLSGKRITALILALVYYMTALSIPVTPTGLDTRAEKGETNYSHELFAQINLFADSIVETNNEVQASLNKQHFFTYERSIHAQFNFLTPGLQFVESYFLGAKIRSYFLRIHLFPFHSFW